MHPLRIERTTTENADFRRLVGDLHRDLALKNGDMDAFFSQFNKIDFIKHVVVAYEWEFPIGIGAIKEFDKSVAEIKRMFVDPQKRGKGIASLILQDLERWAKELGFEQCILETGENMMDAVTLYKKNGYTIIPNYGQYAGVAGSVCFEKHLIK